MICPGLRVKPTQDYIEQFPRSADLVGIVQRKIAGDVWVVKWNKKRVPEDVHASYLEPTEEPIEGDVFLVVEADGCPFPQRGKSREELIAKHVSILWSEYLDEFPSIPPTLNRGQLSELQERAWAKCEALGQRVVYVPRGSDLATVVHEMKNRDRALSGS